MLSKINSYILGFRNEYKILTMLAFFSISVGLWNNFRQLWLEANGLSVGQIGSLLSLGTFFCALCALVFASFIKPDKIKHFIANCLILKVFTLFFLYFMYQSSEGILIKSLIIVDVIVEQLAVISVYPFLITVRKDDILYSKRKLVEFLFKDVGILIGGLFMGRVIWGYTFTFNTFLLVSLFFVLAALVMLFYTQQQNKKVQVQSTIPIVIKKIIKDPILKPYFLYYFVGTTAYNTALGLKMLIMTNVFYFTAVIATNYFLIVGLVADVIGILCLKYFNPKNQYLTVTIKFGFRFFFYFTAFLTNSYIIMFLAITWSLLISTAYENITDAPFINRLRRYHQLVFTYLRYVTGILATAVGLFLGSVTYQYGLSYMLGLSSFLMVFQLGLCYYLVYLRMREKKQKINLPSSIMNETVPVEGQ